MSEHITFSAAATAWLDDKRPQVKASTYCAYLLIVRTHLIPSFTATDSVRATDIQRFVADKTEAGLSRKTIRDILAVLRSILQHAAQMSGVTAPDWQVAIPAPARRVAIPVLTPGDHRKLLRYLADNPTPMTIGVMLSLCTGMRIGEVCALRWTDISLPEHVITVSRTASRIYDIDTRHTRRIITSPKTDTSSRQIPISGILHAALRAIRRTAAGTYVVGDGAMPADTRSYRGYFGRLLRTLGIPHIVFHGLRHTFATRCIESHCDYKTVSVILGHSDIATTLNLYVHPGLDQKKRCIDRMSRSLAKL